MLKVKEKEVLKMIYKCVITVSIMLGQEVAKGYELGDRFEMREDSVFRPDGQVIRAGVFDIEKKSSMKISGNEDEVFYFNSQHHHIPDDEIKLNYKLLTFYN